MINLNIHDQWKGTEVTAADLFMICDVIAI